MANTRKTTVQKNEAALKRTRSLVDGTPTRTAIKVPTREKAGIKSDAKLVAAKTRNLHKEHPKGWDTTFAYELSVEYAKRVKAAAMSAEKALVLMSEYVPFTGWKNPVKALAAEYGLTKYEPKQAKA